MRTNREDKAVDNLSCMAMSRMVLVTIKVLSKAQNGWLTHSQQLSTRDAMSALHSAALRSARPGFVTFETNMNEYEVAQAYWSATLDEDKT